MHTSHCKLNISHDCPFQSSWLDKFQNSLKFKHNTFAFITIYFMEIDVYNLFFIILLSGELGISIVAFSNNFILFYRHINGSVLVLCSEGNAGFYEIGIMSTPLEAGYSVLGWNHPGFAGSTVG